VCRGADATRRCKGTFGAGAAGGTQCIEEARNIEAPFLPGLIGPRTVGDLSHACTRKELM
jgi:hypothetical protein